MGATELSSCNCPHHGVSPFGQDTPKGPFTPNGQKKWHEQAKRHQLPVARAFPIYAYLKGETSEHDYQLSIRPFHETNPKRASCLEPPCANRKRQQPVCFFPYPVDTAKCSSILLPGIRACTFGPAIASRRRGDNRMECIGDVANGSNKPG